MTARYKASENISKQEKEELVRLFHLAFGHDLESFPGQGLGSRVHMIVSYEHVGRVARAAASSWDGGARIETSSNERNAV